MILDQENEFTLDATTKANAQDFCPSTVTAGNAVLGGRVIDRGAAQDIAAGEELTPYARVKVAAAGGSGGWQFDFVAADNAALSSGDVVVSTKTITAAALAINTLHTFPALMPGTRKRYWGLKVTPLTSNGTALTAVVGLRRRDQTPQNGVNTI